VIKRVEQVPAVTPGFGLKYHNARPRRPAVLSRKGISQKITRQSFWSRSSSGAFDFDFREGGDEGKIFGVGIDAVVRMITGDDAARPSVSVGV